MELLLRPDGQPVMPNRKKVIKYWASEPAPCFSGITFTFYIFPFPDVKWLTARERKILRPVLERLPEYLLEMYSFRTERIH